jgi:succinate-semialdehyde dehydrogenase/glutarate-semialdehyde dehydrogenase
MTIQSINPHDGSVLATYDEMTPPQVTDAIEKAHAAFLSWRSVPFAKRATLMKGAARVLRAKSREFAKLMAQEMGKPVRGGIGEIEKCAGSCDSVSRASRSRRKRARASSPSTRSAWCSR